MLLWCGLFVCRLVPHNFFAVQRPGCTSRAARKQANSVRANSACLRYCTRALRGPGMQHATGRSTTPILRPPVATGEPALRSGVSPRPALMKTPLPSRVPPTKDLQIPGARATWPFHVKVSGLCQDALRSTAARCEIAPGKRKRSAHGTSSRRPTPYTSGRLSTTCPSDAPCACR